jgi:hypothetical protein
MESIILLGDDVNLNLILPNDKSGFSVFLYFCFRALLVRCRAAAVPCSHSSQLAFLHKAEIK